MTGFLRRVLSPYRGLLILVILLQLGQSFLTMYLPTINSRAVSYTHLSFEDSKESLKDGKIDAAFIVAGAPTTAITELATTNGVYMINIDGAIRDSILSDCPYYTSYQIPAGTYPGQDEPVETITVKATIVVSENLDDDTVYDMTAAIFDHADEIASENAKDVYKRQTLHSVHVNLSRWSLNSSVSRIQTLSGLHTGRISA